jgi:predicted nucleic acid-binding protein
MCAAEPFIDTNVLLHLLSGEPERANRVEELLLHPSVISVQVLNEFAAVARGKLAMSFAEIREILDAVRIACQIEPLTVETHEQGLTLAERLGLPIYDAMIVAAALRAGCRTLFSEDFQRHQLISRRLRVVNPFA